MLVLVGGLALVAAYYLLSALEVGKIGAPGDFGGGLILLTCFLITAVGVGSVVRDVYRSRRPAPQRGWPAPAESANLMGLSEPAADPPVV